MMSLEELVRPSHSAILVIDVQNDFCHPEGGQAKQGKEISAMTAVVPNIINLTHEGRKAGVPVIFVQNIHSKWTHSKAWENKKGGPGKAQFCEVGTWGAEFYGVQPLPDDPLVIKTRFSAFVGTNLEILLKTAGVETLILSGVTTNTCVESTARQGFMMDYNIVLLKDCTATHRIDEHEAALHNVELNFGFVHSSADIFGVWASK
jgi:ureidoacrylate peracid hydrolase